MRENVVRPQSGVEHWTSSFFSGAAGAAAPARAPAPRAPPLAPPPASAPAAGPPAAPPRAPREDTSYSFVAVLPRARFLSARKSFYVFGRRGNEYGFLGEARCAFTGDRIWAMHLPF